MIPPYRPPPRIGQRILIPVVRGYSGALLKEFGQATILHMVRAAQVDQAVAPAMQAAWDAWLSPVQAYVTQADLTNLQPLDVTQVGAFYDGGYGYTAALTSPAFRARLRRVGRFWWQGEPRLSPQHDWPSLEALLCDPIDEALEAWVQGIPHDLTRAATATYHQGATTALAAFAAALTTHAGIPCTCTRLERQLTLQITGCPLCSNQPHPCPVWVGVVDGLLAWLHKGMEPYVVVNEALTLNHTIVLDLIADVGL